MRKNQEALDLNVGLNTDKEIVLNRTVYFNPTGNIGLGTTAGVGIISTISVTTPGLGTTDLAIPVRSIYLPDHKFTTGQSLTYSNGSGTSLWFQMMEREQVLELPLDSLTIQPFIQSISVKT